MALRDPFPNTNVETAQAVQAYTAQHEPEYAANQHTVNHLNDFRFETPRIVVARECITHLNIRAEDVPPIPPRLVTFPPLPLDHQFPELEAEGKRIFEIDPLQRSQGK